MEFTEPAVREFLTGLVAEALAQDKPELSVRFAQKRFVKKDPAFVGWKPPAGREFIVAFSGESVERFVIADDARRAKLRSAAIARVKEERQRFDPKASGAYPHLCQIDVLVV